MISWNQMASGSSVTPSVHTPTGGGSTQSFGYTNPAAGHSGKPSGGSTAVRGGSSVPKLLPDDDLLVPPELPVPGSRNAHFNKGAGEGRAPSGPGGGAGGGEPAPGPGPLEGAGGAAAGAEGEGVIAGASRFLAGLAML